MFKTLLLTNCYNKKYDHNKRDGKNWVNIIIMNLSIIFYFFAPRPCENFLFRHSSKI